MNMAIPFFLGGGGEGASVRGSRNLWGVSASFKSLTTKDSKKTNDIYAVFLFRDSPPPSPSFWIRPCYLPAAGKEGLGRSGVVKVSWLVELQTAEL